MKRSEFAEIVNGVHDAELKRLADEIPQKIRECDSKNTTADIYALILMNSVEVASRITAEIMTRSGLLVFDPEDSD